jgi:hypothetical protein
VIMSWKDTLTHDGLRTTIVKAVADILENVDEISFGGIKSSLSQRGIGRFKNANLRRFLNSADWISKRQPYLSPTYYYSLKRD